MKRSLKVLVLSSDPSEGAQLCQWLVQLGHDIFDLYVDNQEMLDKMANDFPDLICLTSQAKEIFTDFPKWCALHPKIPAMQLNSSENSKDSEETVMSDLKVTRFSKKFLHLAIQEIVATFDATSQPRQIERDHEPEVLGDRIFVRHKDQMIKLHVDDILYLEADRNYSKIFTTQKDYLLAITLKTLGDKLPSSYFVRVHRSYIVNLEHIDAVADGHLVISRKAIPISRSMRPELMKRLRTI